MAVPPLCVIRLFSSILSQVKSYKGIRRAHELTPHKKVICAWVIYIMVVRCCAIDAVYPLFTVIICFTRLQINRAGMNTAGHGL